MNSKRLMAALGMTVIGSCLAVPATAQQDRGAIEQEIRQVVDAFASALRSGDSTAVLELMHPDAMVFEGGHAETREEYRSGHLRADISFQQAVDVEALEETIVPGDVVSLYMSERRVTGEMRGREIDSRSAETIVLVRTGDGWRIRHIHWSSR